MFETVNGGTGADTMVLSAALGSSDTIDLGAGSDKLTLGNVTNTGSLANTETIIGGTSNDTITLTTAINNGSVDLGAGSDKLTLANQTNRISVANTETIQGGGGNDTIILTGAVARSVVGGAGVNFITGGTGADTFVFDQTSAGNTTTITNFSAAQSDLIGLDTGGSATFSGDAYDLGGASLVNGTNITSVANAAARLAAALSTGGFGGFAYQADTGELFYGATGDFSGGGTLIGVITTNGTTPWTFDVTKFTQV